VGVIDVWGVVAAGERIDAEKFGLWSVGWCKSDRGVIKIGVKKCVVCWPPVVSRLGVRGIKEAVDELGLVEKPTKSLE